MQMKHGFWNPIQPVTYPNTIHLRSPRNNFMQSFGFCSSTNGFHPRSDSVNSTSYSYPPGFSKPIYSSQQRIKGRLYKEKPSPNGAESGGKRTAFLFNVSKDCHRDSILKCCNIFGTVEKLRIHSSRGYTDAVCVFVRFEKTEEAANAIRRLKGTRRFGRSWGTDWSRNELVGPIEEANAKGEYPGGIVGIKNPKVVDFLEKSWLLVNGKDVLLEEFHESINDCGLGFKKCIRWGKYAVIAICEDEKQDMKWAQCVENLQKKFVLVEKLDKEKVQLNRFCWVECYGLPVQAWSLQTMCNIAKKFGKLLALDKETDLMGRADVARLFIEVGTHMQTDGYSYFTFKGVTMQIKMVELDDASGIDFLDFHSCQLGKDTMLDGALVANSEEDNGNNFKTGADTPEVFSTDMRATVVMETPQTPVSKPGVEKVCKRCDKDMVTHEDGELCQCCKSYKKRNESQKKDAEEVVVVATHVTPEQFLSVMPQNQHIRFLDFSEEQVTPTTGQTKVSESHSEDIDTPSFGSENRHSSACLHSFKRKMGAVKGSTTCDCVERHKKKKELFLQEQERKKQELEMKMKDVAVPITQPIPQNETQEQKKDLKKSRGRPRGSKNKKKKKEKERAESSKKGASSVKKGFNLQDEDDSESDTNLDDDLQNGIKMFESFGINMSNEKISKYADFIGAKVPN